jgi:hypothetical protein
MGDKSTSKFPSAYVNSVNEDDSYIVRVNQDMGEIGSRKSGLPKDVKSARMGIAHTGGSV